MKATDNNGAVIDEQNFDAWGRQRNPANWSDYTTIPTIPSWLYRGFTGHEQLPGPFNLINMNGRMYDPLLGRMLSPDNNVQNPNNTQAYNRYSYVVNNPLKYTDPTGWTSFKKFQQTYSKPLFSPNQIAQIYNTGGGNGDETDFGTPGDGTFDAFVAQGIADYNQEQATSAIVSEINDFISQAFFDEGSGASTVEDLDVASGNVTYSSYQFTGEPVTSEDQFNSIVGPLWNAFTANDVYCHTLQYDPNDNFNDGNAYYAVTNPTFGNSAWMNARQNGDQGFPTETDFGCLSLESDVELFIVANHELSHVQDDDDGTSMNNFNYAYSQFQGGPNSPMAESYSISYACFQSEVSAWTGTQSLIQYMQNTPCYNYLNPSVYNNPIAASQYNLPYYTNIVNTIYNNFFR